MRVNIYMNPTVLPASLHPTCVGCSCHINGYQIRRFTRLKFVSLINFCLLAIGKSNDFFVMGCLG